MRTKLELAAAVVAAVAFLAPAAGPLAGIGVAAAAPLGARADLAADGGVATLAQFRDRPDDDAARRSRKDPGSGPGPGVVKPGGGKGKKSADKWKSPGGSKRHSGGRGGPGFGTGLGFGIGGAIIMGAGQCAAQADRCASRYGDGTASYRRCMRDGGC